MNVGEVKDGVRWEQFVANFIINDMNAIPNDKWPLPSDTRDLLIMEWLDVISKTTAKEVSKEMLETLDAPGEIVYRKNLWKLGDTNELESFIKDLVSKSPEQVAQYKQGKMQILGWYTGQIMKQFKGKVDGKEVQDILKRELS